MISKKLWRRRAWAAGAATACAVALLSAGLLPAAAQASTRASAPGHSRTAALRRAETVRIIGHKMIGGKRYPVIYVTGAVRPRAKVSPDYSAGPSTIVNQWSGKCAEVYGSKTGNGANVDQWSCNGTRTQNWYFEFDGIDQYGNSIGNIVDANSGKCFEVYNWGAGNGSNVDQWNCAPLSEQHSNQLWDLNGEHIEAVGASNYRRLTIVAEVNGWSTSNKGNVDIWQSLGDPNQFWHYSL